MADRTKRPAGYRDPRSPERERLPVNGSARSGPRQARFLPAVPLAAGGGGLAGLCLGFGLRQVIDAPPGEMAGPLAIAGGIALAIAAFVVLRARRRDGASGLGKDVGAAASTRHAVEHGPSPLRTAPSRIR